MIKYGIVEPKKLDETAIPSKEEGSNPDLTDLEKIKEPKDD